MHNCLREHRSQLSEACRREELLLEELEAENVELRPSLLRTCRAERRNFCGSVAPGQARVFRCLAEKLSDPDFGEACRNEIISKLHRRQANWKLDPTLRKACRCALVSWQAVLLGLWNCTHSTSRRLLFALKLNDSFAGVTTTRVHELAYVWSG